MKENDWWGGVLLSCGVKWGEGHSINVLENYFITITFHFQTKRNEIQQRQLILLNEYKAGIKQWSTENWWDSVEGVRWGWG